MDSSFGRGSPNPSACGNILNIGHTYILDQAVIESSFAVNTLETLARSSLVPQGGDNGRPGCRLMRSSGPRRS